MDRTTLIEKSPVRLIDICVSVVWTALALVAYPLLAAWLSTLMMFLGLYTAEWALGLLGSIMIVSALASGFLMRQLGWSKVMMPLLPGVGLSIAYRAGIVRDTLQAMIIVCPVMSSLITVAVLQRLRVKGNCGASTPGGGGRATKSVECGFFLVVFAVLNLLGVNLGYSAIPSLKSDGEYPFAYEGGLTGGTMNSTWPPPQSVSRMWDAPAGRGLVWSAALGLILYAGSAFMSRRRRCPNVVFMIFGVGSAGGGLFGFWLWTHMITNTPRGVDWMRRWGNIFD